MASAFISVDTSSFSTLADQFHQAATDISDATDDGVADAGELIAARAREKSAWSSKIPPTIRSEVRGSIATISAGSENVPQARWFEQGRTDKHSPPWKHPVFPKKGSPRKSWTWAKMTRPFRPFLYPALLAATDEATDTVTDAIMAAVDAAVVSEE
jgi:hypothetical protein